MQEVKLTDLSEVQKQDLINFRNEGANKEQLIEYALALAYDCNTTLLHNTNLSSAQMREIRLGDIEDMDISLYSSFDAQKMKELRYMIKCSRLDNRNVLKYVNYSTEQIKVINDFYNEGFLPEYIEWMDDIKYSPALMIAISNVVRTGLIVDRSSIGIDENLSDEDNINNLNLLYQQLTFTPENISELVSSSQVDFEESYDDSFDDDDDAEFIL